MRDYQSATDSLVEVYRSVDLAFGGGLAGRVLYSFDYGSIWQMRRQRPSGAPVCLRKTGLTSDGVPQ
jgi:hypothetical protein